MGFNRALPAPFGFGNGIKPDGVGYFIVPNLTGTIIDYTFTIEFWTRLASDAQPFGAWWTIKNTNPETNTRVYIEQRGVGVGLDFAPPINFIQDNSRQHLAVFFDLAGGNVGSILNNNPSGYTTHGYGIEDDVLSSFSAFPTTMFRLFMDASGTSPQNCMTDEFRMYKGTLTTSEVSLNYNNGIGNNPSKTEDLLIWYKFEQFEMLDFSLLQDGTDIRLGIRDYSEHNNHAQPINLDTNPISPTYVLKPFN